MSIVQRVPEPSRAQVEKQLEVFLKKASVAEWSLEDHDKVISYLRARLGRETSVRDYATVLFAAAQLPPVEDSFVSKHGQVKPCWPLKAAKHALALGVYPNNTISPVAEMNGWTLESFSKGDQAIKNLDPLTSASLRHRMAARAGGYGDSRGNMRLRWGQVSKALLDAVDTLLQARDRTTRIHEARAQMESAEALLISREHRKIQQEADGRTEAALSGLPDHSELANRSPQQRDRWLDFWTRLDRWVRSEVGIVSLTACTAALTLAAFLLLPSSLTPPDVPLTETQIESYAPTAKDVTAALNVSDDGYRATCAPSFSSLRQDAFSCMVGADSRYLLDPCFLVSTDRVSCPNTLDVLLGGDLLSNQAIVENFVDSTWSSREGRVGIEQAASAPYPWMFLLERSSDDGQPYVCRAMRATDQSFTGQSYYCALNNDFPIYSDIGDDKFAAGSWIGVISMGLITAGDLDRTTEPWTVMIKDPERNTTERVAIRRAWF